MNMTANPSTLELDDIQNGALHPRPVPYVGVYILLRIDDRHRRALSPLREEVGNRLDRGLSPEQ
jgi:hypothetical protein